MATSTPPPGVVPYFEFRDDITPVPTTPTHCRGDCGTVLEPLRRTGGLCKACVAKRSKPVVPPTDTLLTLMTIQRVLYRQRAKNREKFVEVRCVCGTVRVMQWSTWVHHKPHCCQKCRLRGIDERGMEPEFYKPPKKWQIGQRRGSSGGTQLQESGNGRTKSGPWNKRGERDGA